MGFQAIIVDNFLTSLYDKYMAKEDTAKLLNFKSLKGLSRNRVIIGVAFIILLILVGYFFFQYQTTQSLLKNPNQASDAEAKALVSRIGSLIELPTDENPTVATVSDVTKLADQPFFAKAVNGDKVLVYAKNKMLILFRPSLNKIITVGTVNVAPNVTSNQATPTPTISPTTSLTPTPTINSVTPQLTPTPTIAQ